MKTHVVAAIAAGALLLGACASKQPQAVTLTAQTMAYSPSTFEVTAGTPVELTLVNEDALEHDFSILEIPVESVSEADPMSAEHEMEMGTAAMDPVLHVAAEPGTTNHLTFTPTKPGTYEFFCTVAGHKDAGMVGTMVVLEP
jgi:uncharacterized cupredoxin-like copper-binding protein